MRFGIVGLGRMGGGIAQQALEAGHEVVAFNQDPGPAEQLAQSGLDPASSLEELVRKLPAPRRIFIWVPHGDPVEQTVRGLAPLLGEGDVVVDGGNSHWEDSRRRHELLAASGVSFLDMGTSGGVEGARGGACFMVGGEREAFDAVAPLLDEWVENSRAVFYAGGPGSGHFVKLIHNGIEFGMLQAIGEGVELLVRWDHELDLSGLFDNWAHGSVIRGWLVELMRDGLRAGPELSDLSTYVEDTGEVKWVLGWALERDIPTPVTADAQQALMSYRDRDSVQAKAVALLRHGFGEHSLHRAERPER